MRLEFCGWSDVTPVCATRTQIRCEHFLSCVRHPELKFHAYFEHADLLSSKKVMFEPKPFHREMNNKTCFELDPPSLRNEKLYLGPEPVLHFAC